MLGRVLDTLTAAQPNRCVWRYHSQMIDTKIEQRRGYLRGLGWNSEQIDSYLASAPTAAIESGGWVDVTGPGARDARRLVRSENFLPNYIGAALGDQPGGWLVNHADGEAVTTCHTGWTPPHWELTDDLPQPRYGDEGERKILNYMVTWPHIDPNFVLRVLNRIDNTDEELGGRHLYQAEAQMAVEKRRIN